MSNKRKHGQPVVSLESLPDELLRHIFTFVDASSVARSSCISKRFSNLALDDTLWRSVAIHHGWADTCHQSVEALLRDIPIDQAIKTRASKLVLRDDGKRQDDSQIPQSYKCAFKTSPLLQASASNRYFEDIASFRDLCMRSWCLARTWTKEGSKKSIAGHKHFELESIPDLQDAGEAPGEELILSTNMRTIDPKLPGVQAPGDEDEPNDNGAWRIKVCPRGKFLITSGCRGGISVVDIESGERLWNLPQRATLEYPHIEYDRGCIVMDTMGRGSFKTMISTELLSGQSKDRGKFTPHALIDTRHPTRALRFQFPLLCVATLDHCIVFVDVPEKKVVQTIRLDPDSYRSTSIKYIDFDDDFVFLGLDGVLLIVVSRRLGQIIWTLRHYLLSEHTELSIFSLEQEPSYRRLYHNQFVRRRLERVHGVSKVYADSMSDAAIAVHPDFSTNTLVILGSRDVLLIRDYVKFLRSWERHKEKVGSANALSKSYYLLADESASDLKPDMFASFTSSNKRRYASDYLQLAVADGRAICFRDPPVLIDLDSGSFRRQGAHIDQVRNLSSRIPAEDHAGFTVYSPVWPQHVKPFIAGPSYLGQVRDCSCVQMDGGAIYAVHEQRNHFPFGHSQFSVLVWDFASKAKEKWCDEPLPREESTLWPSEVTKFQKWLLLETPHFLCVPSTGEDDEDDDVD